ncbi:MAG: PDZ domain-containing protein, partial [Hyphomicrobiales bacterium]|nr:PDZ domain-containing protein [Hyphomicrobiales bacterium]
WIGVQIQTVTPDIADSMGLKQATGALVSEPQKNSPAAAAGIQSGDVITSVDGTPIHDARELARKIGTMAPGTSVKLDIMRDGKSQSFSLTLGELPKEQRQAKANTDEHEKSSGTQLPRLGLTLAPADGVAGAGKEGVVVTAVEPDGPAANHGFKSGDVILEVGGKAVSNPADVRKALADARGENKRAVLMRVKSGEQTRFIALPLGRA